MLKALCNSRGPIRLCQCQIHPTKFHKYQIKRRIHYPRQYDINKFYQLPNFGRSSVFSSSTLQRFYCSTVDLENNENENEEIDEMIDESQEYLENGFIQIRDFLYNHLRSEDKFLDEINTCSSEQDLLTLIKNNYGNIAQHHIVLSVVKFWHCKYSKFKVADSPKHHEDFDLLLKKILHYANQMTLDELSVCFLYLTKLSVNMQTDTMTTVLELILKILKNDDSPNISLSALSRFNVAVNINPQLYTYFICKDSLPHIFYHLDRVTDITDLRLVTICLNNIHQLVSSDHLDIFKGKVQQFIDNEKIKEDSKTVLKILQFLCFPYWSQGHLPLIRKLLLLSQDQMDTFNIRELELFATIFQGNFEPASVGSAITKHATKLLKQHPTAEVLACTVLYATPDKRHQLTELVKEFVFSEDKHDSATLTSLFKILRLLKISDTNTCNEYWTKVKREVISNPSQQESYILSRYCHRYMHFNNNLNGTYRHYNFERAVVELLVNDLEKNITAFLPSKFAKAAAFILGYGHTARSRYVFPEFIIHKIEAMQEQFTLFDCLQLTRGIQIALQMRFKQEIQPELASQLVRLENVFNSCTARHLEQPNLSLNDLNRIVRSYTNRKSSTRTSIYGKIIKKYESIPHHPLTSRIIRDVTFNLNIGKYNVPNLCESLNEYVINNHEFILGDTVQKVLHCFYNLNYYPKNVKLFQYATEVIQRDFECMSGLAIVQASLALAYFKELPGNLIERVFNISFIQRLEDEIEMCYSKAVYPQRVLNAVMQLNRAVCLDFPENGVPWFQQNYIEAQMTKLPLVKNKFFKDVKQMLAHFTTDENLLKIDHVTPYGYKIDFVLYFDKNNNLLPPPKLDDVALRNINKVAILLMNSDSFCQNDTEQLRGKDALKERHLEMMGFKVVQINYSQWNSMYMSLPGAKVDFLKSLLN